MQAEFELLIDDHYASPPPFSSPVFKNGGYLPMNKWMDEWMDWNNTKLGVGRPEMLLKVNVVLGKIALPLWVCVSPPVNFPARCLLVLLLCNLRMFWNSRSGMVEAVSHVLSSVCSIAVLHPLTPSENWYPHSPLYTLYNSHHMHFKHKKNMIYSPSCILLFKLNRAWRSLDICTQRSTSFSPKWLLHGPCYYYAVIYVTSISGVTRHLL